jgi:hypothetical protein
MNDAVYAEFIRTEVLRTRSNAFSIQQAVKDWTGQDIIIREPWKELFIWSKSRWGDVDARWQDGHFYTFGTIEPRGALPDSAWVDIVPVVQRNRALGCYLFPPAFAINGMFLSAATSVFGGHMTTVRSQIVSAIVDGTVGYRRWNDVFNAYAVLSPAVQWEGAWDNRTWQSGTHAINLGYAQTTILIDDWFVEDDNITILFADDNSVTLSADDGATEFVEDDNTTALMADDNTVKLYRAI